jgi:hypothetical protein
MTNENDLIQKLMISKKIMDKHNEVPRGSSRGGFSSMNESFSAPSVADYETPQASYNIPQEYLAESTVSPNVTKPVSAGGTPKERIMNSKLPDEIKRLMMEHPIDQPTMGMASTNPTLSNDLIEKASRLMNVNAKGEKVGGAASKQQPQSAGTGLSAQQIRQIVRETVEQVLGENGLLTEGSEKTNQVFNFRVGEHIFEGKVTKIKKVKKSI